jgi:hypothetical protein
MNPGMKVRNALMNLTCRALYESLGTDMTVRLARSVIPGYDINERTGVPDNIPVTAQAAAVQVLRDVIAQDRFLVFLERLIQVDTHGFMGREYPIPLLPQIQKQVAAEGYVFDRGTGLFMENERERLSPNWGRLLEGEECQIAFLKLDIVKNSALVRGNRSSKVVEAYTGLRELVARSVTSRLGRVWHWEGDGCLCAFLFGQKERAAILCGMELLHELFFFNRLSNPLNAPVRVRLAAHAGPMRYWSSPSALMKEETVREVVQIESGLAAPDSMWASTSVYLPMDRVILDRFGPERTAGSFRLRVYSFALEDA